MDNIYFWQAPGNGKAFDSFIGDNTKMNNRSVGVLAFIKEYSQKDGYVKESFFREHIKKYLQENYQEIPNDSLDTHFYKPLLFYGFIHRDKNYNLSLSIEGSIFLKKYNNKEYTECKKIVLNQLDNTTYPNIATPKVKNLDLFPFRILFKLLLDSEKLDTNFLKSSLVRIVKFDDLKKYLVSKNIQDIKSYKISSSKFVKFNTWVINSLVGMRILKRQKDIVMLDEDTKEHIEHLYKNIDYEDMFGVAGGHYFNELAVSKKRYKRDYKIIEEAKKRDSFSCLVDKKHLTFISNSQNYTEGHHLIPMFEQKNFDFNLDVLDNVVVLCPNCHREVHLADNKKTILELLYQKKQDFLDKHSISRDEFLSIYARS